MAKIHIANFVESPSLDRSRRCERDNGIWQTQNRFQNANKKSIRSTTIAGTFCPSSINGATRTRTGDNIEAALVVSTNQISMDYAYDIVVIDFTEHQHHIKRQVNVQTCLLNDDFTEVKSPQHRVVGLARAWVTTKTRSRSSLQRDRRGLSKLPNMYLRRDQCRTTPHDGTHYDGLI